MFEVKILYVSIFCFVEDYAGPVVMLGVSLHVSFATETNQRALSLDEQSTAKSKDILDEKDSLVYL